MQGPSSPRTDAEQRARDLMHWMRQKAESESQTEYAAKVAEREKFVQSSLAAHAPRSRSASEPVRADRAPVAPERAGLPSFAAAPDFFVEEDDGVEDCGCVALSSETAAPLATAPASQEALIKMLRESGVLPVALRNRKIRIINDGDRKIRIINDDTSAAPATSGASGRWRERTVVVPSASGRGMRSVLIVEICEARASALVVWVLCLMPVPFPPGGVSDRSCDLLHPPPGGGGRTRARHRRLRWRRGGARARRRR